MQGGSRDSGRPGTAAASGAFAASSSCAAAVSSAPAAVPASSAVSRRRQTAGWGGDVSLSASFAQDSSAAASPAQRDGDSFLDVNAGACESSGPTSPVMGAGFSPHHALLHAHQSSHGDGAGSNSPSDELEGAGGLYLPVRSVMPPPQPALYAALDADMPPPANVGGSKRRRPDDAQLLPAAGRVSGPPFPHAASASGRPAAATGHVGEPAAGGVAAGARVAQPAAKRRITGDGLYARTPSGPSLLGDARSPESALRLPRQAQGLLPPAEPAIVREPGIYRAEREPQAALLRKSSSAASPAPAARPRTSVTGASHPPPPSPMRSSSGTVITATNLPMAVASSSSGSGFIAYTGLAGASASSSSKTSRPAPTAPTSGSHAARAPNALANGSSRPSSKSSGVRQLQPTLQASFAAFSRK